jgi:hypothetical protein
MWESSMRGWVKFLLGSVAVVLVAAYAEFVLDFRGPRSQLTSDSALAAITLTSYGDYDAKVKEARARYGDRVHAHQDDSAGKWTITLDDNIIEEGPIVVKLAGMYGVFAVASGDNADSIFSFSIVPGSVNLSHTTSAEILRDRFENFPARFLTFADTDMAIDACAAPPISELGFGSIGRLLRMQSQTYCVAHWKGTHSSSMLISVTLANGDPWMRLFARRICRVMTSADLGALARLNGPPPAYAACVLVDRPDRRRPRDAHDTFESVVYEVRDGTLARMN